MPESYEPTPINQELAHTLGYANALVDVGESTLATAVLFGAAPAQSLEFLVSLADILVAGGASYFAGETGLVTLHESLPPMVIISQDVILTSGEAAAVPPLQLALTYYGLSSGGIQGGVGGFIAGQVLDISTSLGSAAYDIGRAEGVIPQVISLGFYWDSSAKTRIPLPGVPSGQLVVVVIIYR